MYNYGFEGSDDLDTMFSLFQGTMTVFNLVQTLISLAGYVLMAIGLYAIAKRRGIRNPWLAWLPLGNLWILGCISDQYRYIVRREEKNKRKSLLILDIVMVAVCAFVLILCVMMIIDFFPHTDADIVGGADASIAQVLPYVGGILISCLVMVGVALAVTIIQYMAYYDLFASCDPNNKILFLVLSIVIPYCLYIFVFACRKKDLGMPPRRTEIPAQPQPWTPPVEEPWEN